MNVRYVVHIDAGRLMCNIPTVVIGVQSALHACYNRIVAQMDAELVSEVCMRM